MRRPAQIRISFDNTSANRSPPHDDRSCERQSAHGVGPYEHAEPAPRRKALPEHLPREDRRIDLDSPVCSCCGGELHAIGASISEMLDWIPAQVRVLRIRRPKYGCRGCEKIHQAPAPARAIAGGLATPALLAQVLIAKYCLCRYRHKANYAALRTMRQNFVQRGKDAGFHRLSGR